MAALDRSTQDLLALLEAHPHAHALALLRDVPALRVTSTRRTPERNARVGGSPRSFHLLGRAVDLVGPLEVLREGAAAARRERVGHGCTGPEEVLIHDKGSGLHLHVAW